MDPFRIWVRVTVARPMILVFAPEVPDRILIGQLRLCDSRRPVWRVAHRALGENHIINGGGFHLFFFSFSVNPKRNINSFYKRTMVLPRLFNTASRSTFAAAKRNLMFNKGLATAASSNGKVRYVFFI